MATSHQQRPLFRAFPRTRLLLQTPTENELTETLQKQIVVGIEAARQRRGSGRRVKYYASWNGHSELQGKFLLDSVAKPTYLRTPLSTAKSNANTVHVTTSSGPMHAKQSYPMALRLQTGQKIDTTSFVLYHLSDYPMSANDVIRNIISIFFATHGAYTVPRQFLKNLQLITYLVLSQWYILHTWAYHLINPAQ